MQTTQPYGLNARMALPPQTDVFQDEGGYHLVADLPGVSTDRLEISVEEGRLTVVGKRDAYFGGPEQELRRVFQVPDDVDAGAIAAKLTNGVLELTLPKRADAKPRKITVQ